MRKLAISIITILMLGNVYVAKAQGCGDAPSDEGVQVFGFLQAQYEQQFQDETKSTFSFERARIGVQGMIPYDFTYYVVVEYSPYISPNPYLLDAYVGYTRYKWIKASVGSFKTPMGLEASMPCNGLITVYRSTATMQMVAPFRDLGLVFMGGDAKTKFQYSLAIMNGSGLKVEDNNKKKDIVTRVLYRPWEFLQVGGNFRYGYPSYNNNEDSRTTYGIELKANHKNWTLLGEYLADEGDYNRDLGGGCSGELLALGEERSGGWAALAYKTKWEIEPVIKYDFFDSGNAAEYKESNITFGVNYFPNDWVRLQANYIYRTEEPTELMNDAFVIQIQAKF
ncbi:MAG: outer membrane beta-barrel protein [Bacteroidales bacterium]|nr:outer membrane beta-barrel protein [Bacteroidales bacterium]